MSYGTTKAQVVSGFYRQDENTARGNWCGRLDYFAVQLGYLLDHNLFWVVSLAAMQGGGLFLLIYALLTLLLGIPLLYLETSWGQFAGVGSISMWNIAPICKGIGYSTVMVCLLLSCTGSAYCCWSLLYFFRGFSSNLVGEMLSCSNSWNTPNCFDSPRKTPGVYNVDYGPNVTKISAAEEFFRRHVYTTDLNVDFVNHLGGIEPANLGCLFFTWIIVFLVVAFGAKFLGKVAFGSTLFLYLMGFVFLLRAVTLPGISVGLSYLFSIDLAQLARFTLWLNALMTAVGTVYVGFGVHSTLASFNHFKDHSNAESGIIPIVVVISHIFLGLIVYSLVGFLSQINNVHVYDMTLFGPAFIFGTLFEALTGLPGRQGWIVLFYLSLFVMGLTTQMCVTFTVVTAFVDEFPLKRFTRRAWHMIMTAVICVVFFLFGIIFITSGGADALSVVQTYAFLMIRLFIIAGCLIITWVYGFQRFSTDVELMYGYKPFPVWKAFWGVLLPVALLIVWVYSLSNVIAMAFSGLFSALARGLGYLLGLVTLTPIFIYAAFYIIRNNSTGIFMGSSPSWGPQVPSHRARYQATLPEKRRLLDVQPTEDKTTTV